MCAAIIWTQILKEVFKLMGNLRDDQERERETNSNHSRLCCSTSPGSRRRRRRRRGRGWPRARGGGLASGERHVEREPVPRLVLRVRVERLPLLRRRRAVADRHGRGLAVKLVVRPAGRRRVVEEPRDAVVVVVAEELELLQPGRRLGSSIPFHRRLLHPHPLKDRRKPPVQVRRDPAPHPPPPPPPPPPRR